MPHAPIADSIAELLGATARLEASLRVRLRSPERLREFLDGLTVLARPQPMELEVAMLLAWLRRQDPVDLGYTTWSAFYTERVHWGASWRKALVRLVESDLDAVKRAALDRKLPLRAAVCAPGRVARDEQTAWIEAQSDSSLGELWLTERVQAAERGRSRWTFDWHGGVEAEHIRRARHEARACLGRAASAREVDDYLLTCHRNRTPPTQILARAHEPVPAPAKPPELSWAWCPWDAPSSAAEALERMERLQAALRGRSAVLARAWVIVTDEALWVEAGYAWRRALVFRESP